VQALSLTHQILILVCRQRYQHHDVVKTDSVPTMHYARVNGFLNMSYGWRKLSLLFVLLAFSGCGSSARLAGRVPVHPVSGTVTFNGTPVEGAIVNFVSQGNNPVATGKTDASGAFALTTYDANDGAAPGDYIVLITKIEVPPISEGEESSGYPGHKNLSKHLLPEIYSNSIQSPLKATVTSSKSSSDFNFDL